MPLSSLPSSCLYFNPRSPRGGATQYTAGYANIIKISIHAPHEGERPVAAPRPWAGLRNFNPRSPRGGATRRTAIPAEQRYFNPRSPRGGATAVPPSASLRCQISIHAPHEGERLRVAALASINTGFQSTLPTRGSDSGRGAFERITGEFQSTLPTRGSDPPAGQARFRLYHFNPRSPRGGATSPLVCKFIAGWPFQSTLPTRGSDNLRSRCRRFVGLFQSTLPTRGSDRHMRLLTVTNGISIHAPHEGERRSRRIFCPHPQTDFNPRSPRGGATHSSASFSHACTVFQSTLPTRGSDPP